MPRTLIGQEKFKMMVEMLKSLPSFCIIEGGRGSGRTVMTEFIADTFGYPMLTIGCKIDDVRQMVAESRKLRKPTIYYIPDADTMSLGAKNSLLKITEEPPKNLHIIMSLEHRDNTLATIKSRGMVLTIDPYTKAELEDYLIMNYDMPKNTDLVNDMLDIASTPGEIDELMSIGFEEFIAYVDKVYNNILEVSTGNSFKIPNKLKFKKDDEGYSVELFLKVFQKISADDIKHRLRDRNYTLTKEELECDVNIMRCTNHALKEMSVRGANKKAIMDVWILNVRRYR